MSVNLGSAVGYLDLNTEKFNKGINGALHDLDVFSDKSNSMQTRLTALGSSMENVGGTLTKTVTLPIVALGAAATKSAIDFESSMAAVATIADKTAVSMSDLSAQTLSLSDSVGVSTKDLADGLYNLISSTGDTKNAMGQLEIASKLAVGGFTDMTSAVDGATSVLNAYGMTGVESFQMVADVMIQTQNVGKTTVDELSKSLYNVIPTAASLGVKFQDVSSALAAITSQGTPTSVATTQLRQLFVELSKSGQQASDTFKEVAGKSFKEFIASGKNVGDALTIMEQYAKDTGVSLNDLFSSVEAGNAALQLTGVGAEKYKGAMQTIMDSNGSTETAFKTMKDTAGASLKDIINEVKNVAAKFGTLLLPMLKQVADKIKEFVDWLAGLNEQQRETIIKIMAVVAAIGPALFILGKVTKLVANLSTILPLLLSPTGLIIAAVAALTAAFIYFYKTNDEFAKQVNKTFSEVRDTVVSAINGIKEVVSSIAQVFKPAIDMLKASFENMQLDAVIQNILWAFRGVAERIMPLIEGIGQSLAVTIVPAIMLVVSTINGLMNAIQPIVYAIISAIWTVLDLFDVVGDILTGDFDKLKEDWATLCEDFGMIFYNLWNGLIAFFTGFGEMFGSLIVSAFAYIGIDIKQVFIDTYNSIVEFFTVSIPEFFTNLIASITGFFELIGQTLISFFDSLPYYIGYAIGFVLQGIEELKAFMYEFITVGLPELFLQAWEWMLGVLDSIGQFFINILNKFIQWRIDCNKAVVDMMKEFLDNIIKYLKEIPGKFSEWFDKVKAVLSSISLKSIGEGIINTLLDGLKSAWESVKSFFNDCANAIANFIQGIKDGADEARSISSSVDGSHKSGLDYVPFDGYIAELHQGEKVLTKEEASNYGGENNSVAGMQVIINSPTQVSQYEATKIWREAVDKANEGF